jgi:hypothetical protein
MRLRALATVFVGVGICGAVFALSCSSSEDPSDGAIVACSATALPANGARCDPNELGPKGFCRLHSCGWQCGDECACGTDGHWQCRNSCRDGVGCGVAPRCVDDCLVEAGVSPVDAGGDGG